jgi:hypothetical protein
MLTDRAPYEYRYLSRRLLTELFEHDEAAQPRWRRTFELTINLPLVGSVQLRRAPLDRANLRELANRSLQLVSDQTGDLVTPGYYVYDEVELRHGTFEPHLGWSGGEVACYSSEITTNDGERVFLALFGSASNVVGRRQVDEGEGYYPSDMHGLYAILDAAREHDDAGIDFEYLWADAGMAERPRAEHAMQFARGAARRGIGRHRFLSKIFCEKEDIDLGCGVIGRVIVGTPIWIATPLPKPFPGSGRSRRYR